MLYFMADERTFPIFFNRHRIFYPIQKNMAEIGHEHLLFFFLCHCYHASMSSCNHVIMQVCHHASQPLALCLFQDGDVTHKVSCA